jgi:radical SAM superfamily enzyme YgiQ (UPF0313 family)
MLEAPALPPLRTDAAPHRGKVLLINPFYPKDRWGSFGKHALTPSLALTSLAAATPSSWKVHYWDENLLQGPPPNDPLPEIVGISVHLTFADRAYQLADWYRQQGSRVVLGGLHVSACPDEAQAHATTIVVGEGVSVWEHVLRDLRAGRARRRYDGSYRWPHYRDLPPPRRSILPRGSFLTTSSVIATRGCRHRCDFCSLASCGTDIPYQCRTIAQVTSEIEQHDEPYTVFIDNNLGSNREHLRRLCRALRPLERIWSAAVSLDVADDPRLIREMALAGCTGVFVGFETLNDDNLSDANKRGQSTSQYAQRIALFHDNGIQVNGSFVLGFDHDRPDSFAELVRWIDDRRLECATFQILTPYPGTPLFDRLQAAGRILHHDWRLYDTSHAVFRPRHMEPEELERGYSWCYEQVFSHRSIWARRPRELGAAAAYLGMSYLYKKANWLWPFLIRRRLVTTLWRPLVVASMKRHLAFRRQLVQRPQPVMRPQLSTGELG